MTTPKTGAICSCKRGNQRDNCPRCEGTGMVIDFATLRVQTARLVGGWHTKCSRCQREFSSSTDYHTHVAQGCKP